MADQPLDAGHGTLFRNDRREKPSHPEFTGQCEIHGQKYRLAAWVKEKNGKKFFSIAVRDVDPPKPQLSPAVAGMANDEIPF